MVIVGPAMARARSHPHLHLLLSSLLLLSLANVAHLTTAKASQLPQQLFSLVADLTHRSSAAGTKPLPALRPRRAGACRPAVLPSSSYVALADVVKGPRLEPTTIGSQCSSQRPRRGGQVAPPHRWALSRLSEETLGVSTCGTAGYT